MRAPVALLGLALIGAVLWDGFEAMLLPRRVTRSRLFSRLFYRATWAPWAALARRLRPGQRREALLSTFGPLSMLGLFGAWVVGLIVGFALVAWALGSPLRGLEGPAGVLDYLYLSGVTFFTLGFGDLTPITPAGRAWALAEAGVGFGVLAVVIGYLPVLYGAFSRREVTISLLDARAGSPPTAAQLLQRLDPTSGHAALGRFLEEWERRAAELLESHLSFPVLSYYRSQHDNQSWLAALTAILDTSALVLAGVEQVDPYQAKLTFAMARHAVVDLAQVFRTPPVEPPGDRLPAGDLRRLRERLRATGLDLREGEAAGAKLAELRGLYEPFLVALSRYFLLALPPVLADAPPVDNWQTSAWMRQAGGLGSLVPSQPRDDHDD